MKLKKLRMSRRNKWVTAALFLAIGLAMICFDRYVLSSTLNGIYTDVQAVPYHRVAVVLGTGPRIGNRKSVCFETRMDAAAELIHAGKAEKLLVTGDNGSVNYDEATAMKNALIERGVSADRIVCDFAGFRTLDSMVRAKKVFGLDDCIVVTNEFHEPRSVYLARHAGLDAVGFSAKHNSYDSYWRTSVREFGGRLRMLLDVHVLNTGPKFLGPHIKV